MLIPYVPPCTITPTTEISAVHDDSQSQLIEYRIELPEIDHGFGEGRFDTALLENRYIDVSVRSITGDANRAIAAAASRKPSNGEMVGDNAVGKALGR